MDMKLEVVVLPVADVDRAKEFYVALGWRLDADVVDGAFRVVQLTPPGSLCSIIFGTEVTSAAPGSAEGLHLAVTDVEAARAELVVHGVEVSEVFTTLVGCSTMPAPMGECLARIRNAAATRHSRRSATPTATAGCSKRSPPDYRADKAHPRSLPR